MTNDRLYTDDLANDWYADEPNADRRRRRAQVHASRLFAQGIGEKRYERLTFTRAEAELHRPGLPGPQPLANPSPHATDEEAEADVRDHASLWPQVGRYHHQARPNRTIVLRSIQPHAPHCSIRPHLMQC